MSTANRWLSMVLVVAGALWVSVTEAGEIRWRSGNARIESQAAAEKAQALSLAVTRTTDKHVVVQFSAPVSREDHIRLKAAGITLQKYLGDHAFFALLDPQSVDISAISGDASLSAIVPVTPEWKLHPDLVEDVVHPWAVVSSLDSPQVKARSDTDPIVAAYILFHPDVDLDEDAATLVEQYGARIQSQLRSINGLVIELPFSNIKALVNEDAVQWIEPPLPQFSTTNNDNRARTGADVVNDVSYGLDGAGVSVMVYDGGEALASHADFGGRVTVRDSSGVHDHPTHVAGTIGGSGALSGGTYRGMAPAVLIESYGFEMEGGLQEGFLYSDPGDLEADYAEAINALGVDISNNSIGTNAAPNDFPCTWQGDYGVTSQLIDTIVRGDSGNALFARPFRVIWANGNERQSTRCLGVEGFPSPFHSTAPSACAKNHITVGAINSNDDTVTDFTSLGPADDGRLKPDVCAPGCQSNDDNGVTSTAANGGYITYCGTSMAAPTVTGLSALLLQDFRSVYPNTPDPRNSTLKVLLAHSAEDIENPGPDYKTGYGSVRIQRAIDLMRDDNFLEGSVSQGEVFVAYVQSEGLAGPNIKVTLAWDDVPGTPNVNPSLVNDLDLRVFSHMEHDRFPWTLNPADPAAPAVRTQGDHVNNIEQVISLPGAQTLYRIEVRGFNVPVGPQVFSLTATPRLLNKKGRITLNRPTFACESTMDIRVYDSDLNADDNVVETVDVTVTSDSEPAGEVATLTETGPATGRFFGTLNASHTDATSVLLVAPGDAIAATYIDADDGQGGSNLHVTADAVADCNLPVISNVQTVEITPRSAVVTFDTDELTNGVVRYGDSCDALTETAVDLGYKTGHSIVLSNLDDALTYFYSIEAMDQAQNVVSDDNAGLCYSFTTPDVPEYFTEEFDGDFDLEYTSISFIPDGTFDYYESCIEPIEYLPTDPTGGEILNITDDGSAILDLASPVSIYGTSYSRVYVNIHGNITFETFDCTWWLPQYYFYYERVSALYFGLSTNNGGDVSWKELDDRIAVTWQNVPTMFSTNSNTFQIEMFHDGKIRISYLDMDENRATVGLSPGGEIPMDYFESNLSDSAVCDPHPPQVSNATINIPLDMPSTIVLRANDDGLPSPPADLTYRITSLPIQTLRDAGDDHVILPGELPYTLTNGGNQVVYEPAEGFRGSDSFQFVVDDGGIPPGGGESAMATIDLTLGLQQLVYAFPLDTDPGWTTEGMWEFGVPPTNHTFEPPSAHTGSNVYAYDLDQRYLNNMPAEYLTTTAIDCSRLSRVELRFWKWLGMGHASYAQAGVQVSNNGSDWIVVWGHVGWHFNDTNWNQMIFDISDVADGQDTVYVRWVMGPTADGIPSMGWNIDDIEIYAVPSLPECEAGDSDGDLVADDCDVCPGFDDYEDCNGNGVADGCDLGVITYVQNFASASSDYSLNGTAVLDDSTIRLTEAVADQKGSVVFNPVSQHPVSSFEASFDFKIGGGTGADGLSFALFDANMHDNSVNFGEGGGPSLLSISFDTYRSTPADGNHVSLRHDGAIIADELIGFTLNSDEWHHADIVFDGVQLTLTLTRNQWPLADQVEVPFDSVTVPGFVPTILRYGFGARTGSVTDEHRIDKVRFVDTSNTNDCNANGVPDQCDIDANGNSIPDDCEPCSSVIGDVSGDGVTDVNDMALFVAVVLDPAAAQPGAFCAADTNQDGDVNGVDIRGFVDRVLSN